MWIEIPCGWYGTAQSGVTPLAGVWIEIAPKMAVGAAELGHPPRGGVDRNIREGIPYSLRDGHPPRGGVDRNVNVKIGFDGYNVTPLAGVWIEIPLTATYRTAHWSHPPRGGVDRNMKRAVSRGRRTGHPPRGGVDRNAHRYIVDSAYASHPPRGGVDRNPIACPRR